MYFNYIKGRGIIQEKSLKKLKNFWEMCSKMPEKAGHGKSKGKNKKVKTGKESYNYGL